MRSSADFPTPKARKARPIHGIVVLASALALSACADARHSRPEASVTAPMTSQDFEKALA